MRFAHTHNYLLDDQVILKNERRTLYVVILTALMMVAEILAGYMTGSMALLADGWHMASHAGALTISLIAYRLAKSEKLNAKFTFGAGKFIPLGGYTSAIILAMIAMLMLIESTQRLLSPQQIRFNEAIFVAVLGLIVNIVSVWLLSGGNQSGDHHEHLHDHNHDHGHGHSHDHNLRSAYVHVMADAFTSILAIVALVAGRFFNAVWLDSVMGIVGSLVILKWAYNLCRETAWELLDGHAKLIDHHEIRSLLEDQETQVSDLHVWRIAPMAHACEIVVQTSNMKGAQFYRDKLQGHCQIAHFIIEENLV